MTRLPSGSSRWASILFLLAAAVYAPCGAAEILSLLISKQPLAAPSPLDALHLASYTFVLAGVLVLTARRVARTLHMRMVVDGLMGVMAAFSFSWYFLLGPLLIRSGYGTVPSVTLAAYALWDLLLLCCVLLLARVFSTPALRKPIAPIGAALPLLILADTVYSYGALNRVLPSEWIILLAWPAGYLLLAIGAALLCRRAGEFGAAGAGARAGEIDPRIWRHIFPYLLIPAVVALMVYAGGRPGNEALNLGVYLSGAILIELVLVHQVLVYRELVSYANRSTRLESLAAADPVTGLANHRTLVATLEAELERCRRHQRPCSILFLDLDHFKAMNDTFGHPAGDAALREFASVVRSALRAIDTLGRWGGEEFLAVLPETGVDAAMGVAERVRAAVATHTFWAAGGTHLTCSVGVAEYPRHAANRGDLVEAADRAMYAAKHMGRNQVRRTDDSAVLNEETQSKGRRDEMLLGTVDALANLAMRHTGRTSGEMERVRALVRALAKAMGLSADEVRRADLAARLYDIGMAAVPARVFDVAGPLDEESWAAVRDHPDAGAGVVRRVPQLRQLSPAIRAHHERWDGTGYPDGLAGERIPLVARILAVADTYVAMTSPRAYRVPWPPETALTRVVDDGGARFDPAVTEALRALAEEGAPAGEQLLA